MHDEERLQVRVGAVVVAAVAALVVGLLLVGNRHLRPGITIHVLLERVGPLGAGSPVRVSGRQIGVVDRIRLEPVRRAGPRDPAEQPAVAVLDVWIDRRHLWLVPSNAEFFMFQPQIFGEASLQVGPPRGEEPGPPIADGATVRGAAPPRLDHLGQRTYENLRQITALLEDGLPELKELALAVDELDRTVRALEPAPGSYARIRDGLERTVDEGRRLADAVRAGGVRPGDLEGTAARLRRLAERARAAIARVRAKAAPLARRLEALEARLSSAELARFARVLDRAQLLTNRIDALLAQAEAIAAFVERGQGTIGAFLADDELADDFKQTMRLMKEQPWVTVGHPQPRRP